MLCSVVQPSAFSRRSHQLSVLHQPDISNFAYLVFKVILPISNRSIRLSLAVSKYSVKILTEIINIQFACQAFRFVCERGEIRNGIFLNVNENHDCPHNMTLSRVW